MKHYVLHNKDGTVQVMHMLKQEDGTYSTPKIEVSKWTKEKRDEIASWEEIEPKEVAKYKATHKEAKT
jgi:hypothetical protein